MKTGRNDRAQRKRQAQGLSFWVGLKRLFLLDRSYLGLAGRPLGGKSLHVVQALEQVGAKGGDDVAVIAMAHQASGAQFLDAGVQRVGCDVANAVLEQPESLRVAVFECPQYAKRVT